MDTQKQADEAAPTLAGGEAPTRRSAYARSKHAIRSGRAAPTIAVGLVLTVVSWPVTDMLPKAGLDPSWQAGLAMAFLQRLHWGPKVDFTYGPLGFLTVPVLFSQSTAALSLLYLFASRWLLFALLFRSTQPKFPGFWPILAAYIVGTTAIFLVDPADLLMGCVLLIGLLAVGTADSRTAWLSAGALGVIAGLGLLLKFSVGILSLWVAVNVVASAARWKSAAIAGAVSLPASLLVIWVATGNPPGNLSLYLRMSSAAAEGFAGAMSYETGRVHEWLYAGIVLVCLAVSLWFGLRNSSRRVQVCTVLIFLGFTWVAFKEGFVRHDSHDWAFFGLMMVALAGVPWGGIQAKLPLRLSRPVPVVLTGGLALVVLIGWRVPDVVAANPLDIPHDTSNFVSDAKLILDPGGAIDRARTDLEAEYDIPGSILGRLRDQTVAIEPWENMVAWAFGSFTWDPEPVLQQYSAYEASLDNLDASFLRSGAAPTRMLVQPTKVYLSELVRDPFFGAPSTMVARACHYVQTDFTSIGNFSYVSQTDVVSSCI